MSTNSPGEGKTRESVSMTTFPGSVVVAFACLLAFIVAFPCHATTNAMGGSFSSDVSGRDAPGIILMNEGWNDSAQVQYIRIKTWYYPDYTDSPMGQDIDAFGFDYYPSPTSVEDGWDDDGNYYRWSWWGSPSDPEPGTIDLGLYRVTNTFMARLENTLDGMPDATDFPIPPGYIPWSAQRYLQAGTYTQSNAQAIIDHATAIVSDCSKEYEAVMRIMDWCVDSLTYTPNWTHYDALSILNDPTHRAQCAGYSHMAIAMARAVGIPARFVCGISLAGTYYVPGPSGQFPISHGQGPHAWVEVYYPDAGWIPYDPQLLYHYVDTHVYKACLGIDMNERAMSRLQMAWWDYGVDPAWQWCCEWLSAVVSDDNQLAYFQTYPTPNEQAFADYVIPLGTEPIITVQNSFGGGDVQVDVDGQGGIYDSPYETSVPESSWVTVTEISPQNYGGHTWCFDYWSDGQNQIYDYSHSFEASDPGGHYWYTAYFSEAAPPNAPTYLQCEPDNYLHWTDNSNNEDGFQIWEGAPNPQGPITCHPGWQNNWTVAANVTKWCLPNQRGRVDPPDCNYDYKVRAYNAYGNSSFSNTLANTDCGGCPTYGCPYVYTWDGQAYNEDNTILRPSDGCECSYTDYYKLEQPCVVDDGSYPLQLREFEQEHSYVDCVQLWAVDHPADVEVAVAPNGEILPYVATKTPSSCVDSHGRDQLRLVSEEDGSYFYGYEGDWLTVTFNRASGAETDIASKVAKKAQLSSIAVEAPVDTGWAYFAAVHPRENWSSHLTDVSDYVPADDLTFRFRWTAEHKLDFLTLAESVECSLNVRTCPLDSAVHSVVGDVTSKLLYADEDYAELVPIQQIELVFGFVGPPPPGFERDLVLVSTGYYDIDAGKGRHGGAGQTAAAAGTEASSLPVRFSLKQSRPNPFDSHAEIRYDLPRDSRVIIDVYNTRWQLVRQLVSGHQQAGSRHVVWDGTDGNGRDVPNGLYFCRAVAEDGVQTIKMVVLR
jgi:hypothetical protein